MTTKANSNLTVEKGLDKLEKLVQEMESDKIPFEKLVTKYAEGSDLVKHCQKLLQEGELTIEKITASGQSQPIDLDD